MPERKSENRQRLRDMSEKNDSINQDNPNTLSANSESVRVGLDTSSLNSLQNDESRRIMDVVDELRRSGLGGIVQLPQLIVAGDQSSGKSSVLEAITEIPFPRKENLCTRFATEIILRRSEITSITTKIIPDKTRDNEEQQKMLAWAPKVSDFGELPDLIEQATGLMGLVDSTDDYGFLFNQPKAFARDVLSLEISGPNRPHLTLVDLPGLIHSETKQQSAQDVELIRDLVEDYLKEQRTVIMAVISAKNDLANQIILSKTRKVDPNGRRTLGIITKPDAIESGSGEETWIRVAKNEFNSLDLGWHMLRNRSPGEMDSNFEKRNATEKLFFGQGRYRELRRDVVGIESLRVRLSRLLYRHLKVELPALQDEVSRKLEETNAELEKLGESRDTPQQQRRFLMQISSKYESIVRSAVNGNYEDQFFDDMDPDQPPDSDVNMTRLRAAVQDLNLQFSETMRRYGHKSNVEDSIGVVESQEPSNTELDAGYAQFSSLQENVSDSEAISRVCKILARSRGRELPGTFNPLLIGRIFWAEAANWKSIASFHIDKIAMLCAALANAAVKASAADDVAGRLQSMRIGPSLRARLQNAKDELSRIIEDTKEHPITYDPRFFHVVQEARTRRQQSKMKEVILQSLPDDASEERVLPLEMEKKLNQVFDIDMNTSSAEEALEYERAYYKEEVKYFTAAVTKQVIERNLLRDLAQATISPLIIDSMSEDEVSIIAAEPEELTRQRQQLIDRRDVLEKGADTFRKSLGMYK